MVRINIEDPTTRTSKVTGYTKPKYSTAFYLFTAFAILTICMAVVLALGV